MKAIHRQIRACVRPFGFGYRFARGEFRNGSRPFMISEMTSEPVFLCRSSVCKFSMVRAYRRYGGVFSFLPWPVRPRTARQIVVNVRLSAYICTQRTFCVHARTSVHRRKAGGTQTVIQTQKSQLERAEKAFALRLGFHSTVQSARRQRFRHEPQPVGGCR
jgi:hypothetical protein